jgi:hypothetical protein
MKNVKEFGVIGKKKSLEFLQTEDEDTLFFVHCVFWKGLGVCFFGEKLSAIKAIYWHLCVCWHLFAFLVGACHPIFVKSG